MLVSERLILRPIEEKDLRAIKGWKNDPEIKKSLGGFSYGFSEKDIISWYKNRPKNDYRWAIVVISTKKTIGFVGLYNIDQISHHAELGILIGDKNAHGKNFASETTNTILKFAFSEMNLHRIYLYVLGNNIAAIRVYEKNGFTCEGTLRQHIYRDGQYNNYIVMGILRDEYEKNTRLK